MQVGVMITNGGPHPAEKWAVTTAEHIFQIDETMEADRLLQARKVQMKIADALLGHHANVQSNERNALILKGDAHFATQHDPIPDALQAMDDVVAAMQGSPWADKTLDPNWRIAVAQVIASHFATSVDIERQWHADKNPSPAALVYKAAAHGGNR